MSHKVGRVTFRAISSVPRHYTVTLDGFEEPSATAVAVQWSGKNPSFDKSDPHARWGLHEYEPDRAGHKGPLIDYFKSPRDIERYLT